MNAFFGNFLFVLTFFTRVPLPEKLGKNINHSQSLSQTIVLFPIVGILIGLLVSGTWLLASNVLSSTIAAGVALAVGVTVTGALHEDGFADCADGLGGGSNRERTLEIMRDSRIGTYGGIALIFSVGLRWAALATMSATSGACALIIAHTVARSAMTIAMKTSSYARTEGVGKMATGDISVPQFGITILIALIVSAVFGGFSGLIGACIAIISAWAFLKYLEFKIGGYTGDGLGAMQQISEIALLIFFAGAWS